MVHRTHVWQVQTFGVCVIKIEYRLAGMINDIVVAPVFLRIKFQKQLVRRGQVELRMVPRGFEFNDPVVDHLKDIGSSKVGFSDDAMRSVVIIG